MKKSEWACYQEPLIPKCFGSFLKNMKQHKRKVSDEFSVGAYVGYPIKRVINGEKYMIKNLYEHLYVLELLDV